MGVLMAASWSAPARSRSSRTRTPSKWPALLDEQQALEELEYQHIKGLWINDSPFQHADAVCAWVRVSLLTVGRQEGTWCPARSTAICLMLPHTRLPHMLFFLITTECRLQIKVNRDN